MWKVFSSTLGVVGADLPQGQLSGVRHGKWSVGLRVLDVCLLEEGQQAPRRVLRDSHVSDCAFDDVEGAAGLPQVHL